MAQTATRRVDEAAGTEGAAEAPPCTLAGALTDARAAALGEVEDLGGTLASLRAEMAALQGGLDGIGATGDAARVDPLGAIGTAIGAVLATSRQVEETLAGPSCEEACHRMRDGARGIGRSGLEFQMIAKLTLTTVATLSRRSAELDAYSASFDEITKRLLGESADVERRMGGMLGARETALGEFRRALRALGRAHAAIGEEIRRGGAGSGMEALDALRRVAGDLREETRMQIGRLVAAIQFIDAFAQRAEHVVAAAELAAAAEGRRRDALAAVAHALAADLASGFGAMAADSAEALRAIRKAGGTAEAVFVRGLDTGHLDAALRGRERRLAASLHEALAVMPEIEAVASRAEALHALAGAAKDSLADLERISDQIFLSSINAGLISSRTSSQGGPLAVLAVATQEQASQCSEIIASCTGAIACLLAALDALPHDALRGDIADVAGSVHALRADSAEAARLIGSLDTAGARIAASVAALGTIEAGLVARLDAARCAVDRLAAVAGQAAPDAPAAYEGVDLDDLRVLYTMESERRIHDAVLGRTAEAAAPADIDMLDDILF